VVLKTSSRPTLRDRGHWPRPRPAVPRPRRRPRPQKIGLERSRDQDRGLEDYKTGTTVPAALLWLVCQHGTLRQHSLTLTSFCPYAINYTVQLCLALQYCTGPVILSPYDKDIATVCGLWKGLDSRDTVPVSVSEIQPEV